MSGIIAALLRNDERRYRARVGAIQKNSTTQREMSTTRAKTRDHYDQFRLQNKVKGRESLFGRVLRASVRVEMYEKRVRPRDG